jgi:hypothetical protein
VEELTLRPQLQGESSSTLRFRWQVRGTIRDDVWVHPTSFQWGAQSVGSTCFQVLTLESYQLQGYAVEKIECPDGDIQVENQPSIEPGRQRITLRQTVRKTGAAEATVTIHVRLDSGRLVALCVPVSGYGLDKLP